MGRALSVDLREPVMAAVDGGMSCRAAAARFGVGVSSAICWRQQQLSRGPVRPGRPGGNVRSSAIDGERAFLLALVEEQSDLTTCSPLAPSM
jgi:transposase